MNVKIDTDDAAAPTRDAKALLKLEIAARRLVAACNLKDSAETEAAMLELQNHLAEQTLNRETNEATIETARKRYVHDELEIDDIPLISNSDGVSGYRPGFGFLSNRLSVRTVACISQAIAPLVVLMARKFAVPASRRAIIEVWRHVAWYVST